MSSVSAHAKQRAKQRFDIDLDNELVRDIQSRVIRLISNGESETRSLRELPGKSTRVDTMVIAFKVREIWMPGVFHRITGFMITVLPESELPTDLRQGVFNAQR